MFAQVEELGAEGILDAVETWHREQTQREIATFVAAAHFADLHAPQSNEPTQGRVLPGTERANQIGGAGTPVVAEFAAAAFGARIGKSPYVGRCWMADALDVRHRLPRLWARVRAGEVPVGYARHVAQRTRELAPEAAGFVDAEVAEHADGRLCWSRFEALVAGKVVAADPDAAAEKERAAAEQQFAKVSRSTVHGHKTLYVRSAAAAMVRIDATIAYLSAALAALGDSDNDDTRRAKAVLIMANPVQALQLLATFAQHRRSTPAPDQPAPAEAEPLPDLDADDLDADDSDVDQPAESDPARRFLDSFRPGDIPPASGPRLPGRPLGFDPRDLLPPVTLYLHLSADVVAPRTRDEGTVARWEGQGPVSSFYISQFLGPAARFTVKPVIDPATLVPVDAYEIPDVHREAVHLRTPADVFPYAAATTTRDGRGRAQLDHTRRYLRPDHGGPPGQTGPGNLGPMTVFHHRIKTHSGWQVKQPFDGIYLWRDPYGRVYLVDHTGTRPLGNAPPADTDTPDVALDVYPVEIDISRHAA